MMQNRTNRKAFEKALKIIDEVKLGKLSKYKISQSDFFCFFDGIKEIRQYGMTTTITEAVKNLYEKCGFIVETEGIGWKIR